MTPSFFLWCNGVVRSARGYPDESGKEKKKMSVMPVGGRRTHYLWPSQWGSDLGSNGGTYCPRWLFGG